MGALALGGGWDLVRPVLHVDPYISLNPDSPFSERFHISNDGHFKIRDATFGCLVIRTKSQSESIMKLLTAYNQIEAHPGYVNTIIASGGTTIDCPFDRALNTGANMRYAEAEMEFRVRFSPTFYFWRRESCFRFLGVLNDQGRVEWTYENDECSKLPTNILLQR